MGINLYKLNKRTTRVKSFPIDKASESDINNGVADTFVDSLELKKQLERIEITGDYIGSSSTLSSLPTVSIGGKTAVNGDWAYLTADDGANKQGVYLYDGLVYAFVFEIGVTKEYVDRRDDYLSQLGNIRKGMTIRFNSGTGRTARQDGGTFLDWNSLNHQSEPHIILPENPLTFSYIMSDGTIPVLNTSIVPDPSNTSIITNLQYENNGAVSNVASNREIAHRLYVNPLTGDKKLLLAQHQWNTAAELLQKIQTEEIIIPNELSSYEYVGAILVSQNSVNYQDGNNSGILMASEFGSIIGSGGSGSSEALPYILVTDVAARNALTSELQDGIVIGVLADDDGKYAEYRIISTAATWDLSEKTKTYPEINKFNPIPAGGQLSSNEMYYIQNGDTPILPTNPQLDDFIWINNDTSVKDGYGAPFTGMVKLTATDNTTTNFVLPPATRVLMRFDGTYWTSALNMELSLVLTDADDGATLRPGHTYTIISTSDLNFYLLERPFSVIKVGLSGNSTGSVTINQHPNNAPSQIIQNEAGTISDSYTILNIHKGHEVTIKGNTDPLNTRWYWNAPWTAFESSQVVWHTDIKSDESIIGRLNLYPTGSNLTAHTPPTHVQNGKYSVAIGEMTGEITGEITYISNGIAGAGGAWIRQVESLNTRILENITFSQVRSAGTNAASSWSFSIVDIDGNLYPASDWAITATFTQYSGGSTVLNLDKAITNGTINIGRNKDAPFVIAEYVGQNPNGVSAINTSGANGTGVIGTTKTLNYEGTNFSDTFTGSPIEWTTNNQVQATDQGAPWLDEVAYPVGAIISHNEENPADPFAGQLFNWEVITAIVENEFAVWDDTNFATIQAKLRRFPIGAAESFDNAIPYSVGITVPDGGIVIYTGSDQEQGIWQATSDVTVTDENIGNEPFIFRGKLPVQDRSRVVNNNDIISMDVFEMETGKTSISFIVRANETATFIKSSDPTIVELINEGGVDVSRVDIGTTSSEISVTGAARVEFQRNNTQFNWIITNLSATNDAPSVLERETLTPTANTFIITSDRLEWLGTADIGDTVTMPDLSVHNGFDSYKRGTIINSSGQDLPIILNGNTLVANSVEEIKNNRIYQWIQTGSNFLLIYDDGTLKTTMSTYSGRQLVTKKTYGSVLPFALTGNFQTVDLSTDLNGAIIEIDYRPINDQHVSTASVSVDAINLNSPNQALFHWYDTSYIRMNIVDETAKNSGQIQLLHANTAMEIIEIRVYKDAINGFVIPTGKDLVTTRQLVITSPTFTPNVTIIEESASRYYANVTSGQKLVLGTTSDVNITLISPADGLFIAQATGENPTVTFTETPLIDNVQIFTWTGNNDNGNAYLGNDESGGVLGWNFNMVGSGSRQIRIQNVSNRRRVFTSQGFARSTDNSLFAGAGIKTAALDPTENTTLNVTDYSFPNAGDVEYSLVEVFEFQAGSDANTMLPPIKIQEFKISAKVGSSYNSNQWRVELRTF